MVDEHGNWVNANENMNREALQYFIKLFDFTSINYNFSRITSKKILSSTARMAMDRPFEMDEVKTAVFQIDDNNSHGPSGFDSKFYETHWELIKNDVFQAMLGIHQLGKTIREINHTFLCLIPKNVIP